MRYDALFLHYVLPVITRRFHYFKVVSVKVSVYDYFVYIYIYIYKAYIIFFQLHAVSRI